MIRSITYDIRRAILSRTFVMAFLATLASMMLSLGNAAGELQYFIEEGLPPDWTTLAQNAMTGHFSVLWLPMLSALPFAGVPISEMQSHAARYAIFRTGRATYIAGKVSACLIGGAGVHFCAVLVLLTGFTGLSFLKAETALPPEAVDLMLVFLYSRTIFGALWSCVGCFFSVLSKSGGAALIMPVCICYSIMMIGTRFFPDVPQMNPLTWLNEPFGWLLPICLLVSMIALNGVLFQKVKCYV